MIADLSFWDPLSASVRPTECGVDRKPFVKVMNSPVPFNLGGRDRCSCCWCGFEYGCLCYDNNERNCIVTNIAQSIVRADSC